MRDNLDPEASIAQNVSPGSDHVEVGGRKKHIYAYLQDFLFTPERARTPAKALSGGEQNRVLLAKQLLTKANLLILDEPTNDLDLSTLELLEEALCDFDGTLLLISHDRAFLDNVVTQTWVMDTDSATVAEYVGGYEDYLRQRPKTQESSALVAGKKPSTTANTGQSEQKVSTISEASTQSPPSAPTGKKLSYKEKTLLESLPAQIESLEHEQNALSAKLADGSWFVSDPEAAAEAANRLAQIEEESLALLETWTELESRPS